MAKRYEALRAQVLGQAPVGLAPGGLGVLRHRGVAGWMAMEARAKTEGGLDPNSGSWQRSYRSSDPPVTHELVRLLAGAALISMNGREA